MGIMAVYPITHYCGYEILDIEHDIECYVVFRFNPGINPGRKRRSRVRYATRRGPYFVADGHRVYLDECLRV